MTTVLVIEDDQRVQETIVTLLEEEGYQVVAATDGLQGVALAKAHAPALIICDVTMPGLDGYGVLEQLRGEDGPLASVPFIFLTARADRPDMRHGMLLGADDYLTKPFTLDELQGAVDACLAKRTKLVKVYESELRALEEKLIFTLYHDGVTGLPNQFLLRRIFVESAEQAQQAGLGLAVLIFRIDRFQQFLSHQGHGLANLAMEAVANRLKTVLPKGTPVLQLHGERFIALLPTGAEGEQLEQLGQDLIRELKGAFPLGPQEVYLTGSVGIALYPRDGDEVDVLTRKAHLALTEATRLGGDCSFTFSDAYLALTPDQLALERDLHQALVRDELVLYYQPQIDLRTGLICGAEALLRWQHPRRGLVAPGVFIPLAEVSGRMLAIGEWILQTACMQLRSWQQLQPGLRVALNISGRQFHHQNIAELLIRTLADTGLAPASVELEVTESVVMHDREAAVATLNAWRSLGARVSVDDFGTGYSALSYLRELPFHTVKIDQSFVRNLAGSQENAAIVTAVIRMAHELGLTVIAEGVETASDLQFLRAAGCDEVQGFLFSKPIPATDFVRLLQGETLPGLESFSE